MTNRKLHNILEPDGCWHEDEQGVWWWIDLPCRHCGITIEEGGTNPTYSHSDVIAEKMRERGLWEGFVVWHSQQILINVIGVLPDFKFIFTVQHLTNADILTIPKDLKQAIISWWELTHVWKGDRYETLG
jgi:hypothetical protein